MSDQRYEAGMKLRREVLGNHHVSQAESRKNAFDSDFQMFITDVVWGTVWTRPGLDRKVRHLVTIALLAAMGKMEELAIHIRAIENTGVTRD